MITLNTIIKRTGQNSAQGFSKFQSSVRGGVLPLATITALCLFSLGTTVAYGSYDTQGDVSRETVHGAYSVPSSAADDYCKPLLKSNLNTSQSSVDRSQRAVGKIAAFGMILGARFAVEPRDQTNAEPEIRDDKLVSHVQEGRKPIPSAQTVAAFRQCKKEFYLTQASH